MQSRLQYHIVPNLSSAMSSNGPAYRTTHYPTNQSTPSLHQAPPRAFPGLHPPPDQPRTGGGSREWGSINRQAIIPGPVLADVQCHRNPTEDGGICHALAALERSQWRRRLKAMLSRRGRYAGGAMGRDLLMATCVAYKDGLGPEICKYMLEGLWK